MAWDYAELSKAAKAAGGPEKLVETLSETSKASGRKEMTPWIAVAALAGVGITWTVGKVREHFKSKREESEKALEKAKKELVDGIKEYDATHPEEKASENIEKKAENNE